MQSDDLGLVTELRSQAALKRDCNVCDGYGIKDGGRPCLGCGQTGSVPVHWGRVGEMMSEAAAAIERLVAERDEARFLLDEGGQAYRAISDLVVQLDKERALNSELRQFSIDYAVERDRATALAEALRSFIPDEGEAEADMSDDEIGSVNVTLGMVRRARQALGDTL